MPYESAELPQTNAIAVSSVKRSSADKRVILSLGTRLQLYG